VRLTRVHDQGIASAVGRALELVPPGLEDLLTAEWMLGCDAIFAGVSGRAEMPNSRRSYRTTAHVSWPWNRHRAHRDEHVSIVVLPEPGPGPLGDADVHVVLHELGHVVDFNIRQRTGRWGPALPAVTDYAARDGWESFAVAFHSWVLGREYSAKTPELAHGWVGYDPEAFAYFDALAAP
jgi:hypothetical protein